MPLFLMGCFPVDFQDVKRPLRTKSAKRPVKVGKRPINEGKRPITLSFLSLIVWISLLDFYQGISLLKWVFSLVFPGFYAFGRERKALVNLEVFLGENRTTKEGQGKAKVLVGVSVGCLMGCFRAPPPWRKTAPLKRPIKRSQCMQVLRTLLRATVGLPQIGGGQTCNN